MRGSIRFPLLAAFASALLLSACADHELPTHVVPDVPPQFSIAAVPCDSDALIAAIEAANDEVTNPGPDTIELEPGCTYTLTAINNTQIGRNGLPAITSAITINGNGAVIERSDAGGTASFRLFMVAGGIAGAGDLTLNDVTLQNGLADQLAQGGSGGGILVFASGARLTLNRSTVRGNRATAAICCGDGGGIAVSGGTLTVLQSTITGNEAREGGGIWINSTGTLSILNSAIAHNTVSQRGGGVRNQFSRTTIAYSTIAGNSASGGGGGVSSNNNDLGRTRTTIFASIVAANAVGDVALSPSGAMSFESGGYNVIGGGSATDAFNAPSDRTNVTDPGLEQDAEGGPYLADHGGPTQTIALTARSPAFQAIPEGVSGCGTEFGEDQRGLPRPGPTSSHCDVGAFEAQTALYDFSGFFAPVKNLPEWNHVTAGRSIPLRFSLGGDQGTDILAPGSPSSRPVACTDPGGADTLEPIGTPGNSGLTYDAASDQYQLNWRTERRWAGTCRELVLWLDNETEHTALFRFR